MDLKSFNFWKSIRTLSYGAVVGLAVLVLSVSQLYAQPAAGSEGTPRVVSVDPSFDFGSAKHGSKVEHDFVLRNDGDGSLSIRRIQPTCGCTVTVADKTTLLPGETTKIHAVFDTTGFRGARTIPIRVHTSDPKQGMIELTLKGEVVHDVEVKPSRLSFGAIRKGDVTRRAQTNSRTVSVLTPANSGVKITDVTTRSEGLEINAQDVSQKGKVGKRITVFLKDTVEPGTFRGVVVVKTTSPSNSVINIPVFAQVEGDVRFEPSTVFFGLVEGPLTKPLTQSVMLINEGSSDVSIDTLKSDDPAIQAEVKAIEPGRKYKISVTVQEGYVGTLKGQVALQISGRSVPETTEPKELLLRVYGMIAEKGA